MGPTGDHPKATTRWPAAFRRDAMPLGDWSMRNSGCSSTQSRPPRPMACCTSASVFSAPRAGTSSMGADREANCCWKNSIMEMSGTARMTRPGSRGAPPMAPMVPISLSVPTVSSSPRDARTSTPCFFMRSRMMIKDSRLAKWPVPLSMAPSSFSSTISSVSISMPATDSFVGFTRLPWMMICSWILLRSTCPIILHIFLEMMSMTQNPMLAA
mmetsp:Transcript_18031/g.30827  ORF Transcript_18031/g.30827 Transcript_18031/m.30827 type:complete len:213 (-) Transcript_18031:789-1427(-)